MRDGEHTVNGYSVEIKNNRIIHGWIVRDGAIYMAWPYKWLDAYNVWSSCMPSVSAFRKGIKSGRYMLHS